MKSLTEVKLPSGVIESVRKEVELSNGSYENVEDYITHCILFWKSYSGK